MNDVRIAVDHQHIRGTLLTPAMPGGRRAPVLFVHGWGGSQRQDIARARRLIDISFACLTFNLCGHARPRSQTATVNRAHNLRDVIAAYDLLGEHCDVDGEMVGVVGSSNGGYPAAMLTADGTVRWLALSAPARAAMRVPARGGLDSGVTLDGFCIKDYRGCTRWEEIPIGLRRVDRIETMKEEKPKT